MTGQARRDAGADAAAAPVDADADVGADVDADDERAEAARDAAVPDQAGNRVATDTSRGDIAAVVAPGRALGNRRTTAPGVAARSLAAVPACPAPVAACPAPVPACPPTVAAAAAPVAGATVRIAEDDDGLTAAVVRSSRLLPAARNNAGPRAAAIAGSSADPLRASPPIDASARPATGAYDGELRPIDEAADVADFVAVAALSAVRLDGDDAAPAGRADTGVLGDPVGPDSGAAVEAPTGAAAGCEAAAAAAGIRRTTAGSAVPVARVVADTAAIDGADGSERRAVAAATVRAGPVTRRNPAGFSDRCAPTAYGAAVSMPDINGSTATRLRAAVSPGTGCEAGEFAALVVSVALVVVSGALVASAGLVVSGTLATASTPLLAGDAAAVGVEVGDAGAIDLRTTGAAPLDTGAAGDGAD